MAFAVGYPTNITNLQPQTNPSLQYILNNPGGASGLLSSLSSGAFGGTDIAGLLANALATGQMPSNTPAQIQSTLAGFPLNLQSVLGTQGGFQNAVATPANDIYNLLMGSIQGLLPSAGKSFIGYHGDTSPTSGAYGSYAGVPLSSEFARWLAPIQMGAMTMGEQQAMQPIQGLVGLEQALASKAVTDQQQIQGGLLSALASAAMNAQQGKWYSVPSASQMYGGGGAGGGGGQGAGGSFATDPFYNQAGDWASVGAWDPYKGLGSGATYNDPLSGGSSSSSDTSGWVGPYTSNATTTGSSDTAFNAFPDYTTGQLTSGAFTTAGPGSSGFDIFSGSGGSQF